MLICWTIEQTKCISLNCDYSVITEIVEEDIQLKKNKKKALEFQEVISIHAADLNLILCLYWKQPISPIQIAKQICCPLEEKL